MKWDVSLTLGLIIVIVDALVLTSGKAISNHVCMALSYTYHIDNTRRHRWQSWHQDSCTRLQCFIYQTYIFERLGGWQTVCFRVISRFDNALYVLLQHGEAGYADDPREADPAAHTGPGQGLLGLWRPGQYILTPRPHRTWARNTGPMTTRSVHINTQTTQGLSKGYWTYDDQVSTY